MFNLCHVSNITYVVIVMFEVLITKTCVRKCLKLEDNSDFERFISRESPFSISFIF